MNQQQFLTQIAARLGRAKPLQLPPAVELGGVPDSYRERMSRLDREECVQLFMDSWTALTGLVRMAPAAQAAEAIAASIAELKEHGVLERAVYANTPELQSYGVPRVLNEQRLIGVPWSESANGPEGEDAWKAALERLGTSEPGEAGALAGAKWQARSPLLRAVERCQLGIVAPAAVIANTGTLAVLSAGAQGRSVSLMPGMLLAVFPADRIVARMGEAFERLRASHGDLAKLPSSLNLITGPSRSADIENDLTIGIHGPGIVSAVILT
ncbi:LutC/YkgG family protein [Paenibacillus apiarius]|uniref:LUD domain-containing protein n=1 Tax=Paenibacillus apiarius TaxID=46240 RepID=A0ABT4DRK2_9BACL|nr:LUD domain-containing protein [Paenibacillus apiarius]MBN3522392.1 LUD domain-containing protein [Paenibacillus apiarius]MCY9514753.1 LUD domain-containing protein [Paenibacillus apiarius]MCY9518743.1 LUD domain-containing protein [Paenibacillus apiarius]MCY9552816.1 LUD domain-containing protein [Paenibacillus apiarius]MCY9556841.1 LUD domain-containing protein [Paenibacillus apiarius]